MKQSLKIPARPIIRYLNDPEEYYQNGVTPVGGHNASHLTEKVSDFCKVKVNTEMRRDEYTVDIVVFGIPEHESIYIGLHNAWLAESRQYRRDLKAGSIDPLAATTEPQRPRPHRPVRITRHCYIPWGTYNGKDRPSNHTLGHKLIVDGRLKGWSDRDIDQWALESATLFPEKAAAFISEGIAFSQLAMSTFIADNKSRYYA